MLTDGISPSYFYSLLQQYLPVFKGASANIEPVMVPPSKKVPSSGTFIRVVFL